MKNMRVVIWDITGAGMMWMDLHADRIDLLELVSADGKKEGTIPLKVLAETDDWDWLFVFELGTRSYVNRVLEIQGIPKEKVLYPLDMGSIVSHAADSYYMFDDSIRRAIEYYELQKRQRYSFAMVEGDLSYIGQSTDLCIMYYMYTTQRNWAADDIVKFHELSQKYYSFSDHQRIFCDIGANIGTTCVYFKKMIEPDIKILAFEPMPDTYWLLSENIRINDIEKDAQLIPLGLSDRDEETVFYYNPANPGGSSFAGGDESNSVVNARTTTFDSFLSRQGIDSGEIKYLWVDVEGFEGAFVAGGKETLRKLNVPIVVEVTPRLLEAQGRLEQFYSDIRELYRGFIILGEKKIQEYPIEKLEELTSGSHINTQRDIFFLK